MLNQFSFDSDHDHHHDDDVTSQSFVSNAPLDLAKFEKWFGNLLQTQEDIFRKEF